MNTCDYGCGREAKHQFKNGKWCCSKSVLGCKKLSKTARGKKLYKRRKRKAMKQLYESPIAGIVKLDSGWEVEYAKYLDKNNIKWIRNEIWFPYTYGKKRKHYIPDFYLIDEQVYVEIKGRQMPKDLAKWRDFPYYYKLIVLFKDDLEKLIGYKLNQ